MDAFAAQQAKFNLIDALATSALLSLGALHDSVAASDNERDPVLQ